VGDCISSDPSVEVDDLELQRAVALFVDVFLLLGVLEDEERDRFTLGIRPGFSFEFKDSINMSS